MQVPRLDRELKTSRITILNLRDGEIETYGKVSSSENTERKIENLFNMNDFHIFRTTRGSKPDLERKNFEWVKNCLNQITGGRYDEMFRAGIPDYLMVRKDKMKLFFLEVKSEGTGLSSSQVKWLRSFDTVPFKLAYVSR